MLNIPLILYNLRDGFEPTTQHLVASIRGIEDQDVSILWFIWEIFK